MIKKLRTILIDDEYNAIEALHKLLLEYCPQVEIIAKTQSVDEAYELILIHQPDLIFLDIQMPSGSGFDLLARFPQPDFKVIFATAYDFYALNAIKFSALDYLLKPIAPTDLKEAVAKAITQIKNKQLTDDLQNLIHTLQNPRSRKNKINVSTQNGIELIEVNHIIRCEAVNGFTILHLDTRNDLVSSRDLKFYQEIFEEYDFYRVHDSHLVSYHHIKRILNNDGGLVLMSDTTQVPISRRRKAEFMDWLKKY
jgi:two-component system, LytTR family, response regulator